MKKERRFKVKYGFDRESQVSIPEKEVMKALYAQRTGNAVTLNGVSVKGANIISISPNYHYHTGWHDWYEPRDGEDFAQIQRDCPDYDGVLESHKEKLTQYIANKDFAKIEAGEEYIAIDEPKNEVNSLSVELSDKFRIN